MSTLKSDEAQFDCSKLHSYSGYYLDKSDLLKSASGGAISAISEAIIKRGGVVFGAAYSTDYKRVEYKCVETLEGLECLKGSKYCESVKEIVANYETKSVYVVLEEQIKKGKLVLFVGLGCDIGAVKAYCATNKIDTDKLYTIDILCHGPTYSIVHKQYIEALEKKHKSKIVYFSVKYKKEGWNPSYIHAEFENGDVYDVPFYDSDYGFAFSYYSRNACYHCKFKGDNHKADMTCGDFWGLTKTMDGWNENGVSIMFVKTPKGEEMIQMIDQNTFHLEIADTEFALQYNGMYFESRTKDKNYEKFENDLKKKGLHYAVKHFPVGLKARLKRFIKKVLPKSAIKKLKGIRAL